MLYSILIAGLFFANVLSSKKYLIEVGEEDKEEGLDYSFASKFQMEQQGKLI